MGNPTDPNVVGIATMNRFISSYVKQVFKENVRSIVVMDSLRCSKMGEATFMAEDVHPDMKECDVMKVNMKTLGDMLTTYNMNLSLVRFDVENEGKPPSMYIDPNVIEMMSSGRFMNDPAFVYRIRNGLPLVCDRMIILVKGSVTRSRHRIARKYRKI